MSGTTFSTYPVQSQSASHAAPRPGATQAASVEQSYLAASAQYATPAPSAPPAASYDPGPGLTTLAVGEEDGGMAAMPQSMPEAGTMSMPQQDGGGFQVTTLAIGEEDGGAVGGGYGSMSPIRDDHATIGGPVGGDLYGAPVSQGVQQEGYGGMQPIYSPGEAEYPAFAQTSQTTDLLNFHPVARVPKTALPQSMPAAAPAPIAVAAPVTAQPVYAAPASVGMLGQDVPQSGSYESVGSYEDYVGGVTAAPTYAPAAPAQQPTDAATSAPAYEPFVSSYEGVDALQSAPAEVPVYEAAPETYAPATSYDAAPIQDLGAPGAAVAPAATYAPMTSTEPRTKPSLFEKDAPLDYAGGVEAVDPGDGNPGYVAPTDGVADAPAVTATASAEAVAPEATYVEVSIDEYLVDASGGEGTATAPAAPVDVSPAEASDTMPDALPNGDAAPQPRSSLGGSYVVIDDVPPGSTSGASSGAGVGGPDAAEGSAPGAAGEDLRIITLAIGEEAGSQ